MRILIVNPNTTASMTDRIGRAARLVASPETEVVAVNPDKGPASIEGYYDEALCVPGLLEEISKGESVGYDGYVVACYDDPGLDAARTLTERLVVGLCEASIHMASLVATRFSIVTTLARSVPALEELVRRYGVADRCRVRAAEVAVLELEKPGTDAANRIREEIARAIADDRAEAILLGCAGMVDLTRMLSQEFGRPVIDGVTAALKLVEAAVGIGLRTSKTGGYAAPLPKDYLGDFARYAPGGGSEKVQTDFAKRVGGGRAGGGRG